MNLRRWALPVFMFAFMSQDSPAQSNDWAIVKQLVPGQNIKVQLINGKSYRGPVKSVTDDSIVVGKDHSFRKEDVGRVLLPKPDHRLRNTMIGLGAGAATGFGIGAYADASSGGFFPNMGKAAGPPMFGVIGLGIGALLPTGGWREVYGKR